MSTTPYATDHANGCIPELENAVNLVDPSRDALYNFDQSSHSKYMAAAPWATDPNYFTSIRVSAVALLKMVMHAQEGGDLEVMGLMQGYVSSQTLVVTDAYRLPVEGTETRVNAQEEAYEYMVSYLELCRSGGREENAVGWYHSHPGYGCWLSGIDVATQASQQAGNDPFVAVVIDPKRTISTGKVEIGAFRTYPEDYIARKPKGEVDDNSHGIPMDKVGDFGAYSSRYYALDVQNYKSTLDTEILSSLWNRYWAATLSQNPLVASRDFMTDQIAELSKKIRKASHALSDGTAQSRNSLASTSRDRDLENINQEGQGIVSEGRSGLVSAQVKTTLFQGLGQEAPLHEETPETKP